MPDLAPVPVPAPAPPAIGTRVPCGDATVQIVRIVGRLPEGRWLAHVRADDGRVLEHLL